ncbi:hypothetical protein K9I60_09365 [Klebsiella michiganensis]|nr:hypothetical protein [Klebsiella michiganensis]MCZ9450912.1 hypothetical protein [Klebsiella michiganensis]
MKIGPYPHANLAKFKDLFWGKVLEGFWGRKKDKKPGAAPGLLLLVKTLD